MLTHRATADPPDPWDPQCVPCFCSHLGCFGDTSSQICRLNPFKPVFQGPSGPSGQKGEFGLPGRPVGGFHPSARRPQTHPRVNI